MQGSDFTRDVAVSRQTAARGRSLRLGAGRARPRSVIGAVIGAVTKVGSRGILGGGGAAHLAFNASMIRILVHPEYLVCLDCGYKGKTLRRHLRHRVGPPETGWFTLGEAPSWTPEP